MAVSTVAATYLGRQLIGLNPAFPIPMLEGYATQNQALCSLFMCARRGSRGSSARDSTTT